MSRTLLKKWNRWLDRIFEDQLQDLVINQHIFHQFSEVTSSYAGTNKSSELAQWMTQGYVAFAATAIRRIIEAPHSKWKSVSLVILLEDIKKNASLFTRNLHRERYRRASSDISRYLADEQADKAFYKITGNKRATCLSKRRVDRDISALKQKAKPISRLVNKVVAHTEFDRRKIGKVRYKEIDEMIELLRKTYQRYYLLIRASHCEPLVPLPRFDVRDDLRKVWP